MKFILDTDALSSAASGISKASSDVASIPCSSYKIDVESGDGIDFSGAKSALAANISACSDRMKAASTIIDEIASQHTDLQNSLTFENYLNPPTEQDGEENQDGNDSPGDYGGYPGRGPGSRSDSSYVHAFQTETTTVTEEKQAYSAVLAALIAGQIGKQRDTTISSVSYANILSDKLSEEAKAVLNTQDKDDKSGYVKINGRYVIACSEKVGKTGEVIRFTATDGRIVECVVGVNTVTKGNEDKVFLLVNKTEGVTPVDLNNIIAKKGTKATTIGIYTDKNMEDKSTLDLPNSSNDSTGTTPVNENVETNTTTDNNSNEEKGDLSTGGGISV